MLYDYRKPVRPKQGYVRPMSVALASTGRGTANPGIRATHAAPPETARIIPTTQLLKVQGSLKNLRAKYPGGVFQFQGYFGDTEMYVGWVWPTEGVEGGS